MRDKNKTKAQLICEIEELRQRVLELESTNTDHRQFAETIKGLEDHLQNILDKSEQEKAAILDSLVEHVVFQDNDMKVLWANKAACESVRVEREDLLGLHCYGIWADRRSPCQDCPVIKARETGQSQMIEKMTPDGRWWYIQGHPVRDANGHVIGMTELTLDITQQKRAEEMARRAKNELEMKVEKRAAELVAVNETLKQEIKSHREAQKKLQARETQLSATFDALQDLLVVIDKDLRVVMSNWKDHEHISEKDRQAHPLCYEVFMKRGKPCNPCHAMEVFTTGESMQIENTNPNDGKVRDIRALPMFDDKGKVVAVIEHLRDITSQKQAEKALKESERKYRELFKNAPVGFYRTTPDGRILDANPALIEMLGYASFEELAAVNLENGDYHPEYSRRQFRERIENEGEVKGMESFWKRPDGKLAYMRENARVLRGSDGKIVCYEGTIEDITDQKMAAEQIDKLSQQLIKAQEDERQMISRELHDCMAQDLSTLLIELNTFFNRQPNATPENRKKALEFSEILRGTIENVRDLSYDLRLPGLKEMGLTAALSMYCDDFAEKSSLKVDFQSTGMRVLKLDFHSGMNIYRLIQEGLNNIRKHAAARRATVKLIGAYPDIILRIEDDGQGFDVEARARTTGSEKHMGLSSMAERVRLLQGEMTIQSKPLKGTRIVIKIPYENQKND